MRQWEYMIGEATLLPGVIGKKKHWEYFIGDMNVKNRGEILESMSQDGYELVAVSTIISEDTDPDSPDRTPVTISELFYFKRPKE